VFWIATNDKLAKTDKKLFLRISISFTLSQPLQDEIGITERRSPTLHRRFDELELRERAMIVCDALTGMRRSELMGLQWHDLDFIGCRINIVHSNSPSPF